MQTQRKASAECCKFHLPVAFKRRASHFLAGRSQGTRAFAAVRLLDEAHGPPDRQAEDDLESFLHVLIFMGVSYINSNLQNVAAFLQRYFYEDNYQDLQRGSYRARCVREGKIPITQFKKGPPTELRFALPSGAGGRSMRRPRYTHPLNDVVQQLFEWLHARYEVLPEMWRYPKHGIPEGSDSETFTTQRMLDLFDAALQDPRWPVEDKCEDRCPNHKTNVRIMRTAVRMVLPDDVPVLRVKVRERPEMELPAAKRRRRA